MSEQFPLSTAGKARREQILAIALESAHRKRRARVASRAAIVCVGAAIALFAAFHIERGSPTPPIVVHTTPVVQPVAIAAQPDFIKLHGSRSIVVTRIETDPHISTRLAAKTDPVSIERISDATLLEELAAADQPAGIARVGGKTVLLLRR